MKNLAFVVVLTVPLLVASAASAVDEHHPDQKPTAAAPTAPKDAEKTVQQMGENVNKLRAQMDKIQKTRDPAERQKLVQEHMQTLRASMTTAGSMMGAGPGGGMGMGMMGGDMMMDCPMMGQMKGGGMMGEQMMQRMQQMEKRMDMMQMMLEQTRKP